MKTSLLILLVSCSALGLSARASGSGFGELPVTSIAAQVNANGNQVTIDTTRVQVALRLGSPSAVTPDGTWLYHDYLVRRGERDAGQPATLVIRFRAGRVSQLTLADHAATVALQDAPQQPASTRFLAAASSR